MKMYDEKNYEVIVSKWSKLDAVMTKSTKCTSMQKIKNSCVKGMYLHIYLLQENNVTVRSPYIDPPM